MQPMLRRLARSGRLTIMVEREFLLIFTALYLYLGHRSLVPDLVLKDDHYFITKFAVEQSCSRFGIYLHSRIAALRVVQERRHRFTSTSIRPPPAKREGPQTTRAHLGQVRQCGMTGRKRQRKRAARCGSN